MNMTTETITWIDVNERMPELNRHVLVNIPTLEPDDKPVWLGLFTGKSWRWQNRFVINGTVSHWAEMPAGPGGGK